jgi:hypothetical protein
MASSEQRSTKEDPAQALLRAKLIEQAINNGNKLLATEKEHPHQYDNLLRDAILKVNKKK